ncbi:MAG: thioredoxin family protein [Firmicutes bacterium]|nr:thioredoxin family protein [Bacillota bacterium]MCL5015942.1 thioredoxin family protein [Bacillota bacterium]
MAINFSAKQPLITVHVIQTDQFPEIAKTHHVMGVPTTWCEPGPYVFTGTVSPQHFAAYLIQASMSESS